MRHEYRSHIREVAADELYYLKRAGAKGPDYAKLKRMAASACGARIFNHIASYAEQKMPVLLANRPNWPSSYQASDIVETTPSFLRDLAHTSLHDFWAFKREHPQQPYPRVNVKGLEHLSL